MKIRLSFVALMLVTAACSGGGDGEGDSADVGPLEGTFSVVAGSCAEDGTRTGSFFRMVNPGGTLEEGPFVANGDSACADKTFSPLLPGSDGGLTTTSYQPQPDPAFADNGSGLAASITQPTPFFGVAFALATNPTDPQTSTEVSPPRIEADELGGLSGDLSSLGVAWNQQHFNQGSPKPDGSRPGATAGPVGTYDRTTGAYTLTWSTQIVGGPFNDFTGIWHFEGVFAPAAA